MYFAVSSDWTVAPFEWGQVEKDERTQFFIRQKTGGPTLDIFAPLPFESPSGRTTLPHGYIAYHSTFWNPLTNRNEKPSESLKALYIRLLKQLRSGANQLKGKHRVYLVGKGAQEMLRTGCLLGPPFDNTAGDIPET